MEYTHSDLRANYVSKALDYYVITVHTLIILSALILSIYKICYHNFALYQNSSIQADVADGDGNPFPNADGLGSRESHGTNCAGEIAMAKSNSHCGVGVAYNSQITGTPGKPH